MSNFKLFLLWKSKHNASVFYGICRMQSAKANKVILKNPTSHFPFHISLLLQFPTVLRIAKPILSVLKKPDRWSLKNLKSQREKEIESERETGARCLKPWRKLKKTLKPTTEMASKLQVCPFTNSQGKRESKRTFKGCNNWALLTFLRSWTLLSVQNAHPNTLALTHGPRFPSSNLDPSVAPPGQFITLPTDHSTLDSSKFWFCFFYMMKKFWSAIWIWELWNVRSNFFSH